MMQRRTPLKRAAFKRQVYTAPPVAPVLKATRRGDYSGSTRAVAPKTRPQRNRRLLDLAQRMPCLLWTPVCVLDIETTVACHSNQSKHGKAGARKADDQYSVWGCAACHRWLDQGSAPQEEKVAAFDAAHERQKVFWQEIADDSQRPEADRKAAAWALARC